MIPEITIICGILIIKFDLDTTNDSNLWNDRDDSRDYYHLWYPNQT